VTASGLIVHPRSTIVWDRTLLERYRHVAPATIGHFIEDGFMDPAIKPVGRKVKLVGPAVTVYQPSNRSALRDAIDVAQPGDVLVVDRGGERKRANFGEMLALSSLHAGLAGIVIDGPATDILELQSLGFPVFCRGVSALLGPYLATEGTINACVTCGGVVVHPGDLILGDDNGVVVIPPVRAEALLVQAQMRERAEAQQRAAAARWLRSRWSVHGALNLIRRGAGRLSPRYHIG
jgi:4-hydroxy-4-methyl-2-oxoglutarate aldolase